MQFMFATRGANRALSLVLLRHRTCGRIAEVTPETPIQTLSGALLISEG